MIEIPLEVNSDSKEAMQKTVSKTIEGEFKLQGVQNDQAQFNTLQINQEIKKVYFRKNGGK
jgi:hypothetical protein